MVRCSIHGIRKELGWDNLEQRRIKHDAILMYKVMNGSAQEYWKEMFLSSKTLSYNLRETLLSNAKRNFMKHSFKFSGALLWNKLPIYLKRTKTLSSFKKELRHMNL